VTRDIGTHDRVRVVKVPRGYHIHRLARGEVWALRHRNSKPTIWLVKMDHKFWPLAFRQGEIEKV
jgi:hypothetical protein